MKHLLLISNVSKNTDYLLDYAAKFCKHYNCKLHILHLSEKNYPVLISSPYYYNQQNIEWTNKSENKTVSALVNEAQEHLDVDLIHYEVQEGNQKEVLNKFINDNFIDLIILAKEDLEKHTDFSNHKNILINIIDTPLFIIPEYQKFEPLQNFNFLTANSQKDLDDLKKLADLFEKSKITLTNLDNSDNELPIKKDKWRSYVSSKLENRIEHNIITEDLKDYINNENLSVQKKYDAFVFTTKKRSFWPRIFDPSTTLAYLASLEMPCIIFKIT
jgi:hypothetical protein